MSDAPGFRLGCVCAPATCVSPYALSVHPQTGDVAVSFGSVLAICSARTKRQEQFFQLPRTSDADAPPRPVCCSFSPCGCYLATAFDKPWSLDGQACKVVVFAVCAAQSSLGEPAIKPFPSGPRGVCRQVAWSSDGKFIAAAGTDPPVTLWTWPSAVCFAQLIAGVPALALSWGHGAGPFGLMVASPGALVWCQVHLPPQGFDVTLTELPGTTLEPRVLDLSEIGRLHSAQELMDLSSAEDGAVFVITRQGWLLRVWRERLDKFARVLRPAEAEASPRSPYAVECTPGGRVACALADRTVRLFDGVSLNALTDLRCDIPGSIETIGLACGSTLWAMYADGSLAGFKSDMCDKGSPTMLLLGQENQSPSTASGIVALPLPRHDDGVVVDAEDYFATYGQDGLRFCSSSGVLAGLAQEEDASTSITAVAVCGNKQILLACGCPGGIVTGFALQPAVASPIEHFQNMPRFSIDLRSQAEVLAIGLCILAAPPDMSGAFDACCLVAAACADATVEIHRLPFLVAGMQMVFGESCPLASMSESFHGGPLPSLCLFDGGAVVDEACVFGCSDLLGVEEEPVPEQPARCCAFLVTGGPQRLLVREITISQSCSAGIRRVHQEDAHDSTWIGYCSTAVDNLLPNSTVLAADGNGRLVEFVAATGKCCQQTHVDLSEGVQLSGPLGVSCCGRLLAVSITRQGIRQPAFLVVEVKTGNRIADLNMSSSSVRSLAFCGSSARLVALAADGSLLLWHREAAGQQVAMMQAGHGTGSNCSQGAEGHSSSLQTSVSAAPAEARRGRPPIPRAQPCTTTLCPSQQISGDEHSHTAIPGKGFSEDVNKARAGEVSASAVWDALSSSVCDGSGMMSAARNEPVKTSFEPQRRIPAASALCQEVCNARLALEHILEKVEVAGGLHDNSIDDAALMELDKLLAVAEQRLRPLLYPAHARLRAARGTL
mmetsp:Transcript_41609/g.77491  ORF Transcript_41609/g.77491 Transcript_41609/m.77491 type:complete len:948 (-) Transcript_41609:41-2884(-)